MITELNKRLLHTLRRLGFEGEELNRAYLLFTSIPTPLAVLILDRVWKSQAPRTRQN